MKVIFGPQGGYHFLVSVLATGIWPGTVGVARSPDNPVTSLKAFRESGAEFTLLDENVNVLRQAYVEGAAGAGVVLTNRFLRIDTKDPKQFAGEKVRLRVEVVDRDGRAASDERMVVALPPG